MDSPEKIVLTNYSLHKIRNEAIELYKSRHITDLDAELQTTFSIISSFLSYAKQQGWDVPEAAMLDRKSSPKN